MNMKLIIAKKAAGRFKDKEDLENISENEDLTTPPFLRRCKH
jgi:hypothetical protein